jgi:hypothetical protein
MRELPSRTKPWSALDAVIDRIMISLQAAIEESGATVTRGALPRVQSEEVDSISFFII